MDKNQRLTFRKGDLLAIGLVILLAVAVALAFVPREARQGAVVQIYRDGTLVKELPLDTDGTFTVEGDYRNTVRIRDGRVSVTESDCPGGDCVHSGLIGEPGRSIVCLPNRVEIRILGQADVDFVVG